MRHVIQAHSRTKDAQFVANGAAHDAPSAVVTLLDHPRSEIESQRAGILEGQSFARRSGALRLTSVFALRVDGSVVDSWRSLLLVAEVIAVSDFGYSGRECRCRLVRRSKRRRCLRGA
jgi:hypothetical protein